VGDWKVFNHHIDFSKGDYFMKKTALWVLIIAAMMSTTAFGAETQRMGADATMAISDKNGDNRIDLQEYDQRMTEVFFFLDTNKDGSLTIAEIQQVEGIDAQRFDAADMDGNHVLSLNEYLNAVHYDFEVADKNKDGALDLEELRLLVAK
jgi:Ca2+-binding EF-hand superfamily protein